MNINQIGTNIRSAFSWRHLESGVRGRLVDLRGVCHPVESLVPMGIQGVLRSKKSPWTKAEMLLWRRRYGRMGQMCCSEGGGQLKTESSRSPPTAIQLQPREPSDGHPTAIQRPPKGHLQTIREPSKDHPRAYSRAHSHISRRDLSQANPFAHNTPAVSAPAHPSPSSRPAPRSHPD